MTKNADIFYLKIALYFSFVIKIVTDSCLTEFNSKRVEHSWSSIFCMSLSWAEDISWILRSFSADS